MFYLKDLPGQALTFEQAWFRGTDFLESFSKSRSSWRANLRTAKIKRLDLKQNDKN